MDKALDRISKNPEMEAMRTRAQERRDNLARRDEAFDAMLASMKFLKECATDGRWDLVAASIEGENSGFAHAYRLATQEGA